MKSFAQFYQNLRRSILDKTKYLVSPFIQSHGSPVEIFNLKITGHHKSVLESVWTTWYAKISQKKLIYIWNYFYRTIWSHWWWLRKVHQVLQTMGWRSQSNCSKRSPSDLQCQTGLETSLWLLGSSHSCQQPTISTCQWHSTLQGCNKCFAKLE